MTSEQFEKVLERVTTNMHSVLSLKAEQYQRGADRLSNFKTAGRRLNCSPERALLGMVEKHSTAIADYVDDLERGQMMPMEQWDEKIIDSCSYLVLLLALVLERQATTGSKD